MSSNDDSQGWPFSDEAAARDAGIIPPDSPTIPSDGSSADGDSSAAPPEDFIAAFSGMVDADAFGASQHPEDVRTRDGGLEDRKPSPRADHPMDMDDVPSQPDTAQAADHPDETGYQNDADPPR
ncbi:hypothetical protein V6S67_18360 [Arthrobacter sp. Soc17.1.1.1]|uniref:hypothetical protein n=1 Tax=Arthrobacter sp. Soc17.1.1.1 TaxID=3121277 RepID=UPI002FE45FE2